MPLNFKWEFGGGELLSCRHVDVVQVVIRKRVLGKGIAHSIGKHFALLVAVFKTFELVVDAFGKTIGHRFAARDYFAVGHDLPQVVFD